MKIAYLINQYPKVSHSFIRREILALEKYGVQVERVSMRGWDIPLADALDAEERKKTKYLLQHGAFDLLKALCLTFFSKPIDLFKAFKLCLKLGNRSDRSVLIHLIYLLEACKFYQILSKTNATHIHSHFGTNSTEVALLTSTIAKIPYSFTLHGPEELDKPEFIKLSEKIEFSAFVVAISSYCRSQIFRWIDYRQWHKVKIVHCGIENDFYSLPHVPIKNIPKLVCIGRLCPQKGQLLLVDAANILAKKGVNFELVLGGDGELREEIESKINSYGLQNKIRITGWISSDQVRDEILDSKGMVLPSFAEGLPVVLMEAMALRRPVISTYIAGIPELVIDGENGFLLPAGDVDVLVEVIEKFLSLSTSELDRMGENAFSRVTERHSIDTEARKLIEQFKNASIHN